MNWSRQDGLDRWTQLACFSFLGSLGKIDCDIWGGMIYKNKIHPNNVYLTFLSYILPNWNKKRHFCRIYRSYTKLLRLFNIITTN